MTKPYQVYLFLIAALYSKSYFVEIQIWMFKLCFWYNSILDKRLNDIHDKCDRPATLYSKHMKNWVWNIFILWRGCRITNMIIPVSTIKQKHRDQLKKTHSLQYSVRDQTHFWLPETTILNHSMFGWIRTMNYMITWKYDRNVTYQFYFTVGSEIIHCF